MKRIFLSLAIASLAFSMYADLNGNGYYRVRNYGSNRWATMVDDKGEIDKEATNADLHAMRLVLDTDEIITDPGSIIYISSIGGNQYNVGAQGTSIQELIGYNVSISPDGTASDGQTVYRIFGTYKGAVKYIGDKNLLLDDNEGFATISTVSNQNFMKWYMIPVNVESNNYFATAPELNVNGKYYNTLFTSFPYKPYSEGVKAYYIGRAGDGIVEMIEIKDVVPATSPVIIESSSNVAANNKLAIASSANALPSNALTGVYFDYYYSKNLNNRVEYDPETMRLLGVCSDGSLGFVKLEGADAPVSIPANTAYLKVAAGSPSEYKCVSSEEFAAGVESIGADDNSLYYKDGVVYSSYASEIAVYNMAGQQMVKGNGGSLDVRSLTKGAYIAKSGNKSVKIMIN